MTLQEQIDRILELDAKRTKSPWHIDDNDTLIGAEERVICDCDTGLDECAGEILRDIEDEANAAFIASAPQMAEIIRKQSEMLKMTKEGLVKYGSCNVSCASVPFTAKGCTCGFRKALATIEEMEKL